MPSRFKIFFLISAVLSAITAFPVVSRAEKSSAARLREDVEYLSDTLCRGRGAGTAGMVEASRYVIRRFREIGLEPGMHSVTVDGVTVRSIVAELKTEGVAGTVVVCAHADALGIIDGVCYPGADSNASGVAALLDVAGRLKDRPCAGNVIFAVLDGNGLDRAGAKALCSSLKGRKINLVVSLDILGSDLSPVQAWRKEYMIVLGGSPWKKIFPQLDAKMDFYYDYYGNADLTEYFYSRISDLAPFLKAGYPGVLFTSGITLDTNKPSDTPDKLNYGLLERRAAAIAAFVSRNAKKCVYL